MSLLIDIQAKIREGSKGDGYKNWAHRFNIKQTAKTLLFLKENRIDSYDDLLKKSTAASNEFDGRVERIRAADNRLKEIAELQKQIGTYSKTREVYRQYTSLPPKKRGDFFEAHRADITLHQTAKKYFDGLGLKKLPTITALKQEYAALLAEKKKLYCGYKALKENHMALLNAKANAQRILGIGRGEHGGKTTIATERKHSLDM